MDLGDSMHGALGSNRECRLTGVVARTIQLAFTALCLLVHGCDDVSGGAVELSWKFRPASSERTDKFVDCEPDQNVPMDRLEGWGPIDRVQLHWTNSDGACLQPPCDDDWPCGNNRGATRFVLPDGIASLWVTPLCAGGQPAAQDTYIAPAIVQRQVIRGQIVSLAAVELVVSVTGCATAGSSSTNLGTESCICATR
jgi:hypothetical protein